MEQVTFIVEDPGMPDDPEATIANLALGVQDVLKVSTSVPEGSVNSFELTVDSVRVDEVQSWLRSGGLVAKLKQ